MCFMTVRCFNCGAEYHLYFDSEPMQICPHCLAEMPEKALGKLRNALFCLEEANKDFRVAHDERGKPLFQAEIRNHYVPADKFNIE